MYCGLPQAYCVPPYCSQSGLGSCSSVTPRASARALALMLKALPPSASLLLVPLPPPQPPLPLLRLLPLSSLLLLPLLLPLPLPPLPLLPRDAYAVPLSSSPRLSTLGSLPLGVTSTQLCGAHTLPAAHNAVLHMKIHSVPDFAQGLQLYSLQPLCLTHVSFILRGARPAAKDRGGRLPHMSCHVSEAPVQDEGCRKVHSSPFWLVWSLKAPNRRMVVPG